MMAKLFKISPKRARNVNGVFIVPEMEAIVATNIQTADPFYNEAKEVREAFMRIFGVDIKRGCFTKNDFNYETLK
jgi:hypothetical protein